MPQKIPIITRSYLKDVPLPVYATGRYTVISHETIISFMEQEIVNAGLHIEDQEFRAARGGQIATGKYHVKYADDPEIGLMIGFVNSYDKSTRFGCTVGGFNKIYGNSYINAGDQTWVRKHTGNADKEAEQHIKDQIAIASTHYDKIVRHRELFKKIQIHPQLKASILGYLFFEKELLTADQANTVIKNIKLKDSFRYKAATLWGLYNHITIALKSTHPLEWIKTQSQVHDILLHTYALNLVEKENNDDEVLPGQTNLLDEIAAIEVSEEEKTAAVEDHISSVGEPTQEEIDALYEEKEEVELTDQHVTEATEEKVAELGQECIEKFPETMEKLEDDDLDPGFHNAPNSFTVDDL